MNCPILVLKIIVILVFAVIALCKSFSQPLSGYLECTMPKSISQPLSGYLETLRNRGSQSIKAIENEFEVSSDISNHVLKSAQLKRIV